MSHAWTLDCRYYTVCVTIYANLNSSTNNNAIIRSIAHRFINEQSPECQR